MSQGRQIHYSTHLDTTLVEKTKEEVVVFLKALEENVTKVDQALQR